MILRVKDPKDPIGLNTVTTLITLRPKDLNDLNIHMILKSKIHNQYQNYQHLKDLDDLKV